MSSRAPYTPRHALVYLRHEKGEAAFAAALLEYLRMAHGDMRQAAELAKCTIHHFDWMVGEAKMRGEPNRIKDEFRVRYRLVPLDVYNLRHGWVERKQHPRKPPAVALACDGRDDWRDST